MSHNVRWYATEDDLDTPTYRFPRCSYCERAAAYVAIVGKIHTECNNSVDMPNGIPRTCDDTETFDNIYLCEGHHKDNIPA